MLFSPDERESRLLGRDGKAAGIWFANKSRAIRSYLFKIIAASLAK
jgi:hypothetical protein